MADRCDIAIVGGGIVGAAVALGLSQAGFDVRLLEAGAAPPPAPEPVDPRVYAIAPSSASLLQRLGVWPVPRLCAYDGMQVWESAPERALRFSAADVGRVQLGWIAEQSQLLGALWAALPARVPMTQARVLAAEYGSDAARLQLEGGQTLHASLVIAAEGAQSPLRERAGIVLHSRDYGQQAVVTHVECSEPHRGVALQRFLPGGPLALLPLADGRRSVVWSLPADEAQAMCALPDDAFHQALASAIQFEAGAISASTPRLLFPLRLIHAEQYVRERLVLIGDSAHVIHPLAGQGVNLGLGDVEQLLTTLTQARDERRDWSGLRVLRRYERARKAANIEMIALTDALDRAFRTPVALLPRVLDNGLALLDRVAPAKRLLIQRALA